MVKIIKEDNFMLGDILQFLGSNSPFKNDGDLSKSGNIAYEKLIFIVENLEQMGVIHNNRIVSELDYIASKYCEG